MTRLLELAEWAVGLRAEDAPPSVQERLRLQSLSVLGASGAGRLAPDVAPVLAVAAASQPGSCLTVPGVPGLEFEAALRTAGTLSVALDYDDYLLCGHTGHSAHWASWLGAAELSSSWSEQQRAQLAANEVLGRLGGFCLAGRQNGQAWSFLSAVGGALVGGMLRGLSAPKLAHAMSLALARAPHVDWRLFRTGGKVLVVGDALSCGWRAAALAEAGLEGPLDVLEDGSDFVEVFASGSPLAGWLTGLGRAWLTETITFKSAPGCAYVSTAVEALRQVLDEVETSQDRRLRSEDVLRIDVDGGLLTAAMERLLGGPSSSDEAVAAPLNPVGVNFSVAQSLALLLARDGELRPEAFALESLAAAARQVRDLPQRVHVHHDWHMTLASWKQLKRTVGMDRLLEGLRPGALPVALSRTRRPPDSVSGGDGVVALGPPGFGTGLAWSELPLALIQRGLGDPEQAGALPDVARAGLERLASRAGRLAARGVGRLLPSVLGSAEFDLGSYDLSGVGLPVPARVQVLEHGGRVWSAELTAPPGSPERPSEELRALVRSKFIEGFPERAEQSGESLQVLADSLVPAAGELPALPGSGPGDFLARLCAS